MRLSDESLKNIVEIVGLVALGMTVVSGSLVLILGNRINKAQAEELRQFNKDLTEAKVDLKTQETRAANAEHDAAVAKKAAADADTKAEGFRLAIAEANKQAADANRSAEAEKLARVRIEDKLAGWRLSAEAQSRIIAAIRPYAKTPFDLGATPNELSFMETMDAILLNAGWDRQIPSANNPLFNILLNGKSRINYVSGIYVEIAESKASVLLPAAEALARALMAEGIPVKAQRALNEPDENAVHLVIGSK